MAIDREALMEPFRVGGWAPTTRVVTPSVEGDLGNQPERWADQTIEQRRGVAASHVRAWRQSAGAGAGAGPVLRVALPEGEGSRLLFDRLMADFAAIGVTLERSGQGQPADLALVDDVARYPRTSWFLNRLSCQARRGLCSAEADALVAEAGHIGAPATRAVLLAQAESHLTAANVFIPFGAPIRWSLVRGSVGGFAPNPWGWHPLMPLSRLTN
jgi:peptide/nickel transport system substrate-binding protein/oligopeptide transport system substrate-binding protein